MNFTDNNQQAGSGVEPCLGQRADPPWSNASNIIPFPLARASCRQPEKTKSRVLSLPLCQAVRKVKEAVLRLARGPNTVDLDRKRESTTAAAAHYAQHHQAPVQDHSSRTIRGRMSA